ncbi:MAG: molybdopterin-dependent oxidoreductase, partial [Deltaproteobacteria bacterium]|nr:molybdopterin-dependent oxidoreductase [Deltaproteobacteria bacterium]
MKESHFTNNSCGGPISVYVKDGKISRIRPMAIDKNDMKPWTITDANGKKFSPPPKVTIQPYVMSERTRVYAEERIKYPMKRVDFDPEGERHPENRGKSGYERISWEEALDIVTGEIKRVRETYGPEGIASMKPEHHNFGNVGYRLGAFTRFINILGTTQIEENPDSWEGWHWGATHTYGFYWRLGTIESYDLLDDALKYSDMIVYWSTDPNATCNAYSGQESVIWRQWLKESGKKQVFIDPFYNYTAATVGDKWISPRPGTDAAMILAIMHVWLQEDTYDKDYIAKRTIGFDEFKRYVLGEADGVPKTPQWAAKITDLPARNIKALAREWASKKVQYFGSGFGGACRSAYATEWTRLSVLLQAMQGLGKPGVSMGADCGGAPYNASVYFPGYADPDGMLFLSRAAKKPAINPVEQTISRPLFPDAILNPPIKWTGIGFCAHSLDEQFMKMSYPLPGQSEIHMLYRYGSSYIGTFCNGKRWVEAFQSPKLEFIVTQDCWWNNETRLADIVLPACTNMERNDISEFCNAGGYVADGSSACNYRVIVYQQKCIEPLYESKSDYKIFRLLSAKMGI